MKYKIQITPNVSVELTGKELANLHEQLTTIYNLNYEAIELELNHD